jgi:hypothetical protein
MAVITIPAFLLSSLESLSHIDKLHPRVPFLRIIEDWSLSLNDIWRGVLFAYLPTLLLAVISAVVPYFFVGNCLQRCTINCTIVGTEFEKHHLKSGQEYWVMRKTFVSIISTMKLT